MERRLNEMNLLTKIHMLNEAYAVMHGIPIERKFSNRELGPALVELEEAENDVEQIHLVAQEAK